MREDPMVSTADDVGAGMGDGNVVTLANVAGGRLADLLAAASGPAQDHELRGEDAARAAFRAASVSWPAPKRRLRRTPAVMAVTTVATMLVATTGLAAATQLPGSAGRTVEGILGSVGVTDAPPAPTVDAPAVASGVPVSVPSASGARHAEVTLGGCANDPSGAGLSASCTIALGQAPAPVPTVVAPASTPRTPLRHASSPTVHVATGGTSHGGQTTGGSTGDPGTGSIGGGTTRGGNQGAGGGTCGTGGGTTTPTTVPGSDGTTPTTDPTSTAAGCGGHHHGSGSGSGSGSTTTTTTP